MNDQRARPNTGRGKRSLSDAPAGILGLFLPRRLPAIESEATAPLTRPDLLTLLGGWGPASGCQLADFDFDGIVGVPDLLILLANWG